MSEPLTEEQLEEVARTINRVLKEANDGHDIGTAVRVELTNPLVPQIGPDVPVLWRHLPGGVDIVDKFCVAETNNGHNIRVLVPENMMRAGIRDALENMGIDSVVVAVLKKIDDWLDVYRRGA